MVRGDAASDSQWLARQITEAFPWASAPAYLVRDNDRACGHIFTSRVRAMSIRDRPISPRSPWQNGIAERFIGTLRRECLDHMVIFSEMHLRRILSAYAAYYNQVRTSAHALGITERCALASSRPTISRYRRHSDPGWTAPPIRPDVIFGKDRARFSDYKSAGYAKIPYAPVNVDAKSYVR